MREIKYEKECIKCGGTAYCHTNPTTLESITNCKTCGYYEEFVLIVDSQGEWKHETKVGIK